MMGRIWLTSCLREDALLLRREIEAREHAPRIVRLHELERLVPVARALADEGVAAAIGVRGFGVDRIERVVGDLAREACADDIVVVADSENPGDIARFFFAGATEVIAAGDASAVPDADCKGSACMGGDRVDNDSTGEPADDDEVPPWCGGGDTGVRAANAGSDSPAPAAQCPVEETPEAAKANAVPAPAAQCPVEETPEAAKANAVPAPAQPAAVPQASDAPESDGHRAPLVTVVSGRGGVGKTTITAAIAVCAARAGLRVAVLDLDLMCGVLAANLGLDAFTGFEGLTAHAVGDALTERDIEATAMRIGPGLTLWGPCALPEHAELMGKPIEQLVGKLRGLADVIMVDTGSSWGDAAAMAVAACDRCLVVGSAGASQVLSAKRIVELAGRLGVPRTRMTCVFNRVGARGCGEEQALHFEMSVSLRSRSRIAFGGDEVSDMASFGHLDRLMAGAGPFAQSIRAFTGKLMQELGCPIDRWLLDEEQHRPSGEERLKIRLPWVQRAGEER